MSKLDQLEAEMRRLQQQRRLCAGTANLGRLDLFQSKQGKQMAAEMQRTTEKKCHI